MAKKLVKFTVTPSDGLKYWVKVDRRNVDDQLELDDAEPVHILVYWMSGNPGGSLSVVGKDSSKKEVVKMSDTIPAGDTKVAGFVDFSV